MISAAQAVAAAVAMARIGRGRTRRPPLEAAEPRRSVTVVVPARDEAARIGPCLQALRGEDVVVVDDGSTDGTAEVARAHGARVIAGRPLPDGWVGKAWALQQGVEAATGEVVVCLDADTRPRPGLLGALERELDELDFVSAGPRFACDGPIERWLHPSLLATLVYRFGPLDVDEPARPVANGQCTATVRSWFQAAGGYGLSRGFTTDDVALARALPGRVGFRDAAALLEVKMHDGAAEAWREWGRSIGMRDVEPPVRVAADAATVALVMALPVLRLLARRATRLDVALLAVRLALLAAMRGSYAPRGAAYWLSPLADPLSALRLVLPPSRTWRGRTYGARGRAPRRAS